MIQKYLGESLALIFLLRDMGNEEAEKVCYNIAEEYHLAGLLDPEQCADKWLLQKSSNY